MTTFPYRPITRQALALKMAKRVHGVGINDADYMTHPVVDGKQYKCPFYARWIGMLNRDYYDGTSTEPAYKDCRVCDEWLTFSVFSRWMTKQDWEGNELDKDILVPGNRMYSPETCIFVSRQIKTMMQAGRSGKLLPGVRIVKGYAEGTKRYEARVNKHGNKSYLGYFYTEQEAHQAYKKGKAAHIREVADLQAHPLREALYLHAEILEKPQVIT